MDEVLFAFLVITLDIKLSDLVTWLHVVGTFQTALHGSEPLSDFILFLLLGKTFNK